jgi:hypothetical protein
MRDTDSVTGEFFPARSTTAGESVSLLLGVSLVQKGVFLFSSTGGKKGDFLFSTGGESKAETLLFEFSLPLYRRRKRDFFFLGDDDELVTGAETGANARECKVFDRAFSRVS